MTEKQAIDKAKELKSAYLKEVAELKRKYLSDLREVILPIAREKARFREGSIIEANIRIRIERIGVQWSEEDIVPVYAGPMLTKNNVVRKDNPRNGAQIIDDQNIKLVKL